MALISLPNKDQANDIVNQVYKKFEQDTGQVPEWVQVMGHRPEILKEFTELFKTIMGPGEIESYLKWKIAYVVSETLRCKFCVDVTKKMLAKMGASDEETINIIKTQNLPEEEKEILALVKDVTLDGYMDQPEILEKLKEKLNEPQLVEIVSVFSLFNYINRFNNTFGVLPE